MHAARKGHPGLVVCTTCVCPHLGQVQGLPPPLPHCPTCSALPHAGSVRFADEQRDSESPSPAAAPAAPAAVVPKRLEVRFGFLLVGGIYCTDLLQLEEAATGSTSNASQQLQPEVCGLKASNLSVGVEQRRLVLRLWAEQEGPFEADFTLALSAEQQVSPDWGHACQRLG